MEFLASLAIKALIGTSICGSVTVGAVYKYDKTLLGFAPSATNTNTSGQGTSDGDKDRKSLTTKEGGEDSSKEVNEEGGKTDNKGGESKSTSSDTKGKSGSLEIPETQQSPETEVALDESSVDNKVVGSKDTVLPQSDINNAGQGENSSEESSDKSDSDGDEESSDDGEDTNPIEDSASQGSAQTKSSINGPLTEQEPSVSEAVEFTQTDATGEQTQDNGLAIPPQTTTEQLVS